MKVYVHYEEGSDAELHVTLKLTLPKKWNDESPVKLLQVCSTECWLCGTRLRHCLPFLEVKSCTVLYMYVCLQYS